MEPFILIGPNPRHNVGSGGYEATVGQCYIIGTGESWVKIAGGTCHQWSAYQVVSRGEGDINRCPDLMKPISCLPLLSTSLSEQSMSRLVGALEVTIWCRFYQMITRHARSETIFRRCSHYPLILLLNPNSFNYFFSCLAKVTIDWLSHNVSAVG